MAAAAGTIAILTVLIYNPGAVPGRTLAGAQKLAGDILAQAGVILVWRNASAADSLPSPAELAIHLLPQRPPRLHYDAEGFAVIHPGPGSESYAGISYPAVVDTAGWLGGDVAVVLGAAFAHEIGHLLLRSGTHSPSGVMAARMRTEEVLAASRGELRFSAAESARIRAEGVRRNR